MGRKAPGLLRVLLLCSVLFACLPGHAGAQEVTVDRIMSLMTVEERVGQVFMVDFEGTDLSNESSIAELVLQYKIGSVFISEGAGNFDNSGQEPLALQVSRLTNQLQNLAYQASSRSIDGQEVFVPLFVAVEQEGNGYPNTALRSGFTPLPSNMVIGASWSEDNARDTGAVVGRELAAVGVNLLLGPVADVLDTPRSGESGDLGTRVFGGSPYWVGQLTRAYVRGVHEGSGSRVATVVKHFPGHGGSGRDPEHEVATISSSLEELRSMELVPFAAATESMPGDSLGTTDGLMVGHIRSAAFQEGMQFFSDPLTLDEQGLATAMSLPEFAAWESSGLLVSDFLGAEAIKEHLDAQRAGFPHLRIAREALIAGNDILPLVQFSLSGEWETDALPRMVETIEYFQDRYRYDPEFRPLVDESVRKILQAKLRLYGSLSLDTVLVDEQAAPGAVGGSGDSVRRMAEESVTLLYPTAEELAARTLGSPTTDDDILILQCFEDCYSSPVASGDALQSTLVRLYGPQGAGRIDPARVNTVSFRGLSDWIAGTSAAAETQAIEALLQESEWVIIALTDYNPDDFPASRAAKDLLGEREQYLAEKRVVAIAYDAPYHLDSTEVAKLTAYYAVYGKTAPSLEASLRPLFDPQFAATGAPPVDVPGIDYDLASALQPGPDQMIELERLAPPVEEPLYVGGDPLVVRTSVILDKNGHPVPDGTEVEFRGSYLQSDIFVEPQVVTNTVAGVAGASFVLGAPAPAGMLEVSAASGDAGSHSLIARVILPVTPFPTFTPTATATATPTPTVTPLPPTPTIATPTPVPVAPPSQRAASRPVDWLDFTLMAGGTTLGSIVGLRVRRGRPKGWDREVQLILYGVALALVGYLFYGLGFLNPASLLGLGGLATRITLLLLCTLLAFLPSVLVWVRRN